MDYIQMTPGLFMLIVAIFFMITAFLFAIIKDIIKEWIIRLRHKEDNEVY